MLKAPLTLAIAFTLACIGKLGAVPVFANPLNNTLSGYASNDPAPMSGSLVISQQIADDFFFTSVKKIASITWFGNYANDEFGAGSVSDFEIRLFADIGDGSLPANAAPFFSQNVAAVAESTGVTSIDNHNVLSYAANLAFPVFLPQGTYWLSIVESDPLTIDETGTWEWASTETGSGAVNVRRIPPSTPNWISVGSGMGAEGNREDRVFILDDKRFEHPPHPEHPHVPDAGSTVTLLGMALCTLGGIARRWTGTQAA